MYGIG
jgi:hypothetical protein